MIWLQIILRVSVLTPVERQLLLSGPAFVLIQKILYLPYRTIRAAGGYGEYYYDQGVFYLKGMEVILLWQHRLAQK